MGYKIKSTILELYHCNHPHILDFLTAAFGFSGHYGGLQLSISIT